MIRMRMNIETKSDNRCFGWCQLGERLPLPVSQVLEVTTDLPKTGRDDNQDFTAHESGQVVRICRNTCCKGKLRRFWVYGVIYQFWGRLLDRNGDLGDVSRRLLQKSMETLFDSAPTPTSTTLLQFSTLDFPGFYHQVGGRVWGQKRSFHF